MPVNKITADQFVTRLNEGILSRNNAHDVEIGPIADLITRPSGQVFESQNDRIRTVSQLILLDQSAVFTDSDVDSFVKNEELFRNTGGKSSGTLVFSRAAAPSADITVQRGYPVATQPDTSTGETVVFVTTEQKTLVAALSSTFFNLETERYELEVAVQCTVGGTIGQVGPNRINRPLRTLVGFDNVYNKNRTTTVVDRETNTQLIERYKLSILSTQLGGKNGIRLFILSNYQDAGDVLVVTPGDPLITRSGTNGNAIDVYISGAQSLTRQDTKAFIGIGQLIVLDEQPVQNITSVSGYILNTDYEFIKDVSGVSNSTRSQDGIKFLPTAITLPVVGGNVVINYEQNILVSNIQNDLSADPDNMVGGQDILIRSGAQVDIVIAATLTILPGFAFTTIKNSVVQVIVDYINTLKLGEDVEQSDLQAVVRSISGVDNFVFTLMDRSGGIGNADILVSLNEFARITSTSITIT